MMLKPLFKKSIAMAPFVIALGFSILFLFYITPDEIVSFVGLGNAYLLMFLFAALGGATTFNTIPYYSLLVVLSASGLHPFILGLSSALGVMAGDSFSYFVGHQGVTIVPAKLKEVFRYMYEIALTYPRAFPLVCFAYGSLSPLSNDFITIPAGMARIPYFRVMIPLALGNIVFNVSLAYVGLYAYDALRAVFVG